MQMRIFWMTVKTMHVQFMSPFVLIQISESSARTALLAYVKNHCCWGVGVARHMSVTGIRHTYAYHVCTSSLYLHYYDKIFKITAA